MDNTKFNLVSIILFIVLVGLGVLAVITLTPPKRYVAKAPTTQSTEEVVVTNPEPAESVTPETPTDQQPSTPSTEAPTTGNTALKHAELIANLQKLIDGKVILKAGDKGTNVGYIQTFFNLYNKTNDKVDADYGPGLSSTVKSFQSKNSITPQSGQVAEKTLTKMIEWLKAQG